MNTIPNKEIELFLRQIPDVMRRLKLWSKEPPNLDSLQSMLPFKLDTMSAEVWLQWVYLPKMLLLIEQNQSLPRGLSGITPYFEEALKNHANSHELLVLLAKIDNLLPR